MGEPHAGVALIGRDRELGSIDAVFTGGARLVSIIGTSGVGKTALARAYLEAHRQRGGGGDFCELSAVHDARDLPAAVARCLGVVLTQRHGGDAVDQLEPILARRDGQLLVLDNFEQLVAGGADAVQGWTAAPRGCRVLITSRERVRVPAEHCLRLEPLEVEAALDLFTRRVRQLRPSYEVEGSQRAALVRVVDMLDRLPLAIELAASRMSVLGERQLLELIDDRFSVLSDRRRPSDDRHATLRTAIESSWRSLSLVEQGALAAASVFRGGFSFEAFDSIASPGEGWPEAGGAGALSVLEALHDKSLLDVRIDAGGEARYGLLESIRALAHEALVGRGEEANVLERHARYYLALGGDGSRRAARRGGDEMRRLTRELANVRAVYDRAMAGALADAGTRALEAALVMEPVFHRSGPYEQYLTLVGGALERADPESGAQRPLLARAHLSRGSTHLYRGFPADAARDFLRAIDLAAEDEVETRALALIELGFAEGVQLRWEAADEHLRRAEALVGSLGDPWLEGALLRKRGTCSTHRDDSSTSRRQYEAALARFRAAGATLDVGHVLGHLGGAYFEEGDLERATRYLEEATAVLGEAGEQSLRAYFGAILGLVDLEEGHLSSARWRVESSLRTLYELGNNHGAALAECFLGHVELVEGHWAAALSRYDVAVETLAGCGDKNYPAIALGASAVAEARLGRVSEARERIVRARASCERPRYVRALDVFGAAVDALGGESERAREVAANLASPELLDEVRLAAVVLRQTLSGAEPVARCSVSRDGRWFEAPGSPRVELGARSPVARVLAALAVAALERRALDNEQLFERGWPGEKIHEASARSRVKVAISTLRKKGLRDVLLHGSDGYWLDPSIAIVSR